VVDVKTDVVETLKDLRAELRGLAERISLLESEKTHKAPLPLAVQAPAAPPAPQKTPEAIPEDILLVISAAVAAFLGERVPIHQIRLISSPGWAVQGRVFIQASHYLNHSSR
jgi:methylmalonyl-CoA carboxyltransferase 12S subunit